MHIPVNTPLTPELFAPLFEVEEQLAALDAEYQTALLVLRKHVNQIQQRMDGEKQAITGRFAALDDEEARIKTAMQTAAKDKARASLHGEAYQEGQQTQAAKFRLLEIPAERAALEELVTEIGITGEEQTRYESLHQAARSAGEAADQAKSRRDKEIKRIFPIVKDQFETACWSGGRFYEKDLSSIETAVYNMREVTRYGKKIY